MEARALEAAAKEETLFIERGLRAFAWIGVSVAALWLVMSMTYPFGWDQGLFAWVGGAIVEGGLPYRDAWDFKGPLVYYTYALAQALFGVHLWSIRVVDAVLLLIATAAIWRTTAALTEPATARWAALFFVLWYASHSFWHTAQPDGWAGVLLIVSIGPLVAAGTPGRPSRLAVAGAAIGAATLFKPFYAAFLILPLLHVWLARPAGRIRATVVVAVAWLAPLSGVAAWFAWQGGLEDLIAVHVRYSAAYVGLSPEAPLRRLVEYFLTSRVVAVALPVVIYGGVVLWRGGRRPAVVVLVAWAVLVVAGVTLQNRFYAYHWLPILPAATVLGAAGLHSLTTRARVYGVLLSSLILVHCLAPIVLEEARFLSWLAGRIDRTVYYNAYGEPGDDMRAVWWLQQNGKPGSVFVFGWHSAVAWLSERQTVSRFGYSLPLMMGEALSARAAYRSEAIEALSRTPPDYIISGTQSEQIMGQRLTTADFPELAGLIASEYREAVRLGRITIFERRIAP